MSRRLFIVEHWVLMEYETKTFCFLEKLQFHLAKCVILMFFSYFHYWILILKLNMSRFEWIYFISINFMTCFNPNLDQNIGLWILYLPKKNSPIRYFGHTSTPQFHFSTNITLFIGLLIVLTTIQNPLHMWSTNLYPRKKCK